MDGTNGDRQRIADLERRMERVETGISTISEQIGALRTDLAVGFARLETRQEAEDRATRSSPPTTTVPTGLGSIVATPERQAAAILGTLIAAIIAAVLQLLGIELGGK